MLIGTNAPDRAAHSSLSWGDPGNDYALYGMSNKGKNEILKIARAWNNPPEIVVKTTLLRDLGYDHSQRAYILDLKGEAKQLLINIKGSTSSPVHNPAFIIRNYDAFGDLTCSIDGIPIINEKDFRYDVEYDVNGAPMTIIWIKTSREDSIDILIKEEAR